MYSLEQASRQLEMEDVLTVILGGEYSTSKRLQSMDMKVDKRTRQKHVAFSMLSALKSNLFCQPVIYAIKITLVNLLHHVSTFPFY